MADPTQAIVISAGTVGTVVLGALNWMFKRQVKINDDHGHRLNELERDNATKQDLDDLRKDLGKDITRVEGLSIARLTEIDKSISRGFAEQKQTLDAAHRRVDDLYRNLTNNKGK